MSNTKFGGLRDLKTLNARPAVERLFDGDKHNDADPQFQEILNAFKEKLSIDLTHMHFIESATPRNHDADAKTDQADIIKYTGSWTKYDAIFINPDMSKAMEFYGIKDRVKPEDLRRQAIAHELAHEIYEYPLDDCMISGLLKKAKDMLFDTAYLHHIDGDDKDEELFCEYVSYRITGVWIKA